LFHLISKLYGNTSLLITTNLAFADWPQVFGDAKMTSTGTARSENARRGAYVDPVSTTQTDRRARAIYIAADKLPPIMMESHRIRRSPPSREM
jgi:hypothetical protein